MIATIARKEFIEMLRDGRFRWAASIVLALLAIALLAGAYYQRELVAQQRAAQAPEQARWYAQEPKNPHAAAHYGLYAFKPRLAPAFLDPGSNPIRAWPSGWRRTSRMKCCIGLEKTRRWRSVSAN